MSYFKAKMHLVRFRLGTPLGEVTALPRPPNWMDLRGPTSKGREGNWREGKERGKGKEERGKGREGRRRGRGKEGKGEGCIMAFGGWTPLKIG